MTVETQYKYIRVSDKIFKQLTWLDTYISVIKNSSVKERLSHLESVVKDLNIDNIRFGFKYYISCPVGDIGLNSKKELVEYLTNRQKELQKTYDELKKFDVKEYNLYKDLNEKYKFFDDLAR